MDKFSSHTGTALPLRRSNVDTDQIIPAVYLKRVTKTGFEDGLFAAWRSDPSFVLNPPRYARATILIPGPDFGTRRRGARGLGAAELRVQGGARLLPVRRHLPQQLRQGRAAGRRGRAEDHRGALGLRRGAPGEPHHRGPGRADHHRGGLLDDLRDRRLHPLAADGGAGRHRSSPCGTSMRSTASSRPARRSSRRHCRPRSRAGGGGGGWAYMSDSEPTGGGASERALVREG